MKRRHLSIRRIFQVLFVLIISQAQLDAQGFEFGIQSGIVLANSHLVFDPSFDESDRGFDPIISFSINGFTGYRSSSFWEISAEPGYIQKGSLQIGSEDDSSDDIRIQCHYLQIPIVIKTRFADALYFSLGPELGYLIKVNSKPESMYDLNEFYDRKYELSGLVGFGFTVFSNLDFELRYNHGITHKLETNYMHGIGTEVLEGKVRDYNEYFQMIVRYRF